MPPSSPWSTPCMGTQARGSAEGGSSPHPPQLSPTQGGKWRWHQDTRDAI